MKLIHLIAAARPNFMKIAPLFHTLKNENWCKVKIIHTGQHYDDDMSGTFFKDLRLPKPDYNLEVGSGSHAKQTGNTMIAYERICLLERPDLVIVVGDVNAILACSITAKKLHIKVAHLEAGLRSFDRDMPEEINRMATDSISDLFWTPSKDADENLIREGHDPKNIEFVGNIMIDSYHMLEPKIEESKILCNLNLKPKEYIVFTLHRPSNVDKKEKLIKILDIISNISEKVLFPVHPRTENNLSPNVKNNYRNITFIKPLSYISFIKLVKNSKFIITDSGGIQEESTYLKIPCFTLRKNTERPVTVDVGSNKLIDISNLKEKIKTPKVGQIPDKWDGKTSLRIRDNLKRILA